MKSSIAELRRVKPVETRQRKRWSATELKNAGTEPRRTTYGHPASSARTGKWVKISMGEMSAASTMMLCSELTCKPSRTEHESDVPMNAPLLAFSQALDDLLNSSLQVSRL